MNQVRGIFGLTMEDHIGKIAFPAVQVKIKYTPLTRVLSNCTASIYIHDVQACCEYEHAG